VKLPAGYWIGWGAGGAAAGVSAAIREHGVRADALLVFSGVPLALTGGIAALLL
jgi:cobalt-zinc-cadmium resistance protein CzcA